MESNKKFNWKKDYCEKNNLSLASNWWGIAEIEYKKAKNIRYKNCKHKYHNKTYEIRGKRCGYTVYTCKLCGYKNKKIHFGD